MLLGRMYKSLSEKAGPDTSNMKLQEKQNPNDERPKDEEGLKMFVLLQRSCEKQSLLAI